MNKDQMSAWKKMAIKSLFFGVGFALTIAAIGGIVIWYIERPKPWNTDAITAEYDAVDTEGDNNTLVFYYMLRNNAKKDYSITEHSEIPIFFRSADEECLSGNPSSTFLTYGRPVFIPAGHKMRFSVHLKYPYPESLKKGASREDQEQYRKKIEKHIGNEFRNLDGFVLFDKSKHYEIRLQRGWEIPSDDGNEKK